MAVSAFVSRSEGSSEVERVQNGVLDLIRSHQILPGQRLDQRRLAKQLDSTTAPLREALSSLEAKGFLVRERGLGVFCRSYTVRELEEMIEIRGVLEGLAARWAVSRLTPETRKELQRLAVELEQPIPAGGEEQFIRTHVLFHRTIMEVSQNSMLRNLMDHHYLIDAVLGNVAPALWSVQPHDHHSIVEALASGDADRAEAAMRAHIAPTFKSRLEALRQIYGEGPILPTKTA
ncbi:MAG: GntR family transcriptional regulator [Verrucomicrobium sp.]|nr:GntR family transcriptional regulator [Verrucomicrobium sp.]